jgi:hypothetical protein
MTKFKTRRSFKVPFKLIVVNFAKKVANIRVTAKKYKINRKTERKWKNQEEHLKGNIELY